MTDVLSSDIQQTISQERSLESCRRKIRLFRNGDRYYPGREVSIRLTNYTHLKQLLHDLSQTIDLPYGVRRLFTPTHGSEVTNLDILQDGGSYVGASFEPFQKLQYNANVLPGFRFPVETSKNPLIGVCCPLVSFATVGEQIFSCLLLFVFVHSN